MHLRIKKIFKKKIFFFSFFFFLIQDQIIQISTFLFPTMMMTPDFKKIQQNLSTWNVLLKQKVTKDDKVVPMILELENRRIHRICVKNETIISFDDAIPQVFLPDINPRLTYNNSLESERIRRKLDILNQEIKEMEEKKKEDEKLEEKKCKKLQLLDNLNTLYDSMWDMIQEENNAYIPPKPTLSLFIRQEKNNVMDMKISVKVLSMDDDQQTGKRLLYLGDETGNIYRLSVSEFLTKKTTTIENVYRSPEYRVYNYMYLCSFDHLVVGNQQMLYVMKKNHSVEYNIDIRQIFLNDKEDGKIHEWKKVCQKIFQKEQVKYKVLLQNNNEYVLKCQSSLDGFTFSISYEEDTGRLKFFPTINVDKRSLIRKYSQHVLNQLAKLLDAERICLKTLRMKTKTKSVNIEMMKKINIDADSELNCKCPNGFHFRISMENDMTLRIIPDYHNSFFILDKIRSSLKNNSYISIHELSNIQSNLESYICGKTNDGKLVEIDLKTGESSKIFGEDVDIFIYIPKTRYIFAHQKNGYFIIFDQGIQIAQKFVPTIKIMKAAVASSDGGFIFACLFENEKYFLQSFQFKNSSLDLKKRIFIDDSVDNMYLSKNNLITFKHDDHKIYKWSLKFF